MKSITKLALIILIFILIDFLPAEIAVITRSLVLIPLICILIIVVLAARQLGLLHIPTLKNDNSRTMRCVSYRDINVSYTKKLNGGGLGLSYEFVRLVSKHIGKVEHIHECCSGPGFIGFNLLAHNLCDRLTLSDVNPEAIQVIQKTIRDNQLEDRVTVYQSDCLDSIPEDQKWDLIVSNPPWHIRTCNNKNLILCDPGAQLHKRLFNAAHNFLKPAGSILFVESHEYTTKKDMEKIALETNLQITGYFAPGRVSGVLTNLGKHKVISKPMAVSLPLARISLGIYFVQFKPGMQSMLEDV